MSTLSLPGGGSATLRERLTYGQAREVRAALLAVDVDKAAMADLDLALVRAYTASWDTLDVEGRAVSLDTPEGAPDDVIQAIALAAMQHWQGTAGKPLPKAGNGHLPTTPPGRRSKSPTRT